ncbi:hypothetical protein SAMD00023353_3300740 [Rosellinia necatrix]|uniref:Uncharacterized protein n=1 Tax=Rosellinia necatrix TaxID=77044 RepID=A0A1W2TK70_ROSNE|nr:hypothetical protein SAMD00023353_3300740 [Rosellinia necatrix]
MVPQQSSRSRGRILAVLAVAVFFIALWNFWSPADDAARVEMSGPVVSALKVSLRQESSSPPKLTIGVTNTHSGPVTVFTWDSPLDPLAVQLGLLSFTPEGSDGPVDIPVMQVRRLMPPGDDAYVTIEPGKTEEREVILKKPMVPLDQLQGKVKVVCKGTWKSVWAARKEDIPADSLKNPGTDDDAFKGSFESEPVDMEL